MRRGKLRFNSKAVAGFFEDLPALMVVTIAFTVFTITLINLVVAFVDTRADINMYREGYVFMENVKSYERILVNATYTKEFNVGRFDADKLDRLEADQSSIGMDLGLDQQMRYGIDIVEYTDYYVANGRIKKIAGESWHFGEGLPDWVEEAVTYSTAVAIRHGIFNYTVGTLNVTVWWVGK